MGELHSDLIDGEINIVFVLDLLLVVLELPLFDRNSSFSQNHRVGSERIGPGQVAENLDAFHSYFLVTI